MKNYIQSKHVNEKIIIEIADKEIAEKVLQEIENLNEANGLRVEQGYLRTSSIDGETIQNIVIALIILEPIKIVVKKFTEETIYPMMKKYGSKVKVFLSDDKK